VEDIAKVSLLSFVMCPLQVKSLQTSKRALKAELFRRSYDNAH